MTAPPGNPAYTVSKAGLNAFTEGLSHQLRAKNKDRITAHLLVPGFVHTGMIGMHEKPLAAIVIDHPNSGDFHVLCPDNNVPHGRDEKRIAWNAGDVIDNRPALSR
ncbi:MAG: SDR family NAD(P)-dependent oxidoreductase [Pseudomonadota bacterium]